MVPTPADDALDRLLEEGRARAEGIGPAQARLWAALAAATEGGKRFRPALVLATHQALGGTADDAAAAVGAAIELLHTAFVIHDDVIDGDDVRRGRPNVSGTYAAQSRAAGAAEPQARHFGRTAGILAGDLALTAAVRAVATCPAPVTTVRRLLDLFDGALHTTAAGELADVRLSLGITGASLADVLTMEEQKTSGYSFQLPLQSGAVLAGADDRVVEPLGAAGRMLGIAFQLLDDVLGVFGDPAATGKSVIGDLREGKQTPLIAHARTTRVWPQVSRHLGRSDLTETQADGVRALLEESGSRRFVEELAGSYLTAGHAQLHELGMPPTFLDALTTLTDDTSRSAA